MSQEDRVRNVPRDGSSSQQAIVHGRGLTLRFYPAARPSERTRVYDLREAVYRGRCDYLLASRDGSHSAEDAHDPRSYLFACGLGEEPSGPVVAACRFTPGGPGLWEAGESWRLPAELEARSEELLQISRVVAREDIRRLEVTEVMMHLACRWLIENSPYRRYFALCLPRLARFYGHFGAELYPGSGVCLPERNSNRYQLIHGELEASASRIAEHLSQGRGAGEDGGAWRLPVQPPRVPAVVR